MKFFLASCLTILSYSLQAQNPGYLGKKNIVEVFGTIQTPLFSNLLKFSSGEQSYMKKAGKLEEKKDVIDVGYHVNVSHAFSRRFGLAFEFGFDYFSIHPGIIDKIDPSAFGYDYRTEYFGKHENLSIRSRLVMPKIEFTSKGGILPVGITHQLGLGFRSMNVVKKDYLYSLYKFDPDTYLQVDLTSADKSELETNLCDYKQRFKGMSLVYVLNLRSPISQNILLNYGVRYTLNFMKRNDLVDSGNEESSVYWHSDGELQNAMRDRSRWSFIFLHFGVSLAL